MADEEKGQPRHTLPFEWLVNPQKQFEILQRTKENLAAWAELGKAIGELTAAVRELSENTKELTRRLK